MVAPTRTATGPRGANGDVGGTAGVTPEGRDGAGPTGAAGPRLGDLTRALAGLLRQAPFRVVPVDDVLPFRYTKLLYNAALCPLAAAGGLGSGRGGG